METITTSQTGANKVTNVTEVRQITVSSIVHNDNGDLNKTK